MDHETLRALGAEVADIVAVLRAEQAAALAALRAELADPVVAFSRELDGTVQLIQRNGPARPLPIPDLAHLVSQAVRVAAEEITATLRAEVHAAVARAFEGFANAPAWSAATVYTEGQVVQAHIGRTYRVRAGVKATLGRDPGEDVEHWERLGTGGLRLHKSRPAALEAGDVYTEADSRFLFDGQTTVLLVPKAVKQSDIERAVKGPHGLAQAAQSRLAEHETRITAATTAANDASERSVTALALIEALERRLDGST